MIDVGDVLIAGYYIKRCLLVLRTRACHFRVLVIEPVSKLINAVE